MVSTRAATRRRRSCTIKALIGSTDIEPPIKVKPIREESQEEHVSVDENFNLNNMALLDKSKNPLQGKRKRKFVEASSFIDDATGTPRKRSKELEQKLRIAIESVETQERLANEWKSKAEALKKERDLIFSREEALRASVQAQQVARAALEVHNEWLSRQNENMKTGSSEVTELKKKLKDSLARIEIFQKEIEEKSSENELLKRKIDSLLKQLNKTNATRRALHEELMTLRGNIRVYCRVRPRISIHNETPFSYGEDVGTTQVLQVQSELLSSFDGRTETRKTWKFCFDRVFTESASQSEVFDEVAGLIQSALDGKNCCIFAYGQTGSGKTYTMLGDLQCENKRGIIPRSIDFLFEQKETLKDYYSQELNFSVSFLEIYNDKLQDLLHKSGGVKPKYSIRHSDSGKTTVSGLTSVPVSSSTQVLELLQFAAQARATGKTNCNKRSSRSHSVFSINITTNGNFRNVLHLVDLAGSERLSQSGSIESKKLLKETQSINKSLSALGHVISSLVDRNDKGKHIPYRDCKLTYLLQNSLGGSSKTLMFTNLSPEIESLNESVCTLRFAEKSVSTLMLHNRR